MIRRLRIDNEQISFTRLSSLVERISHNRQMSYAFYAAALGGVLLLSRFINPDALPGMCIFRSLTGIPCMFCGLTHAFHAISMGDFQAALNFHPLAFVAYGLVILHMLLFLMLALDRHERIPRWKVKPNTLLLATFAFFTLVWIF